MRPSRPSAPGDGPVALVLPSVIASGTERRISFVYRHLTRRFPGAYRLILAADLFPVLNRGGFALDQLPGVHVFGRRSVWDRKRGAHANAAVNLGRMATLLQYRAELRRLISRERIGVLHPYLELVPVLGWLPLPEIPWIVPLVDHLPKYFDGRSLGSRLLQRACSTAARVDCLDRSLARRAQSIGVDAQRLCYPEWNCVNHEAFHPEEKDPLAISFAARAIDFKNPLLMVNVIERVHARVPGARFAVLGKGDQESELARIVARRKWQAQVEVGYRPDPSPVVNRSLIHLSLETYDNLTNQSLLEGMAAGSATLASDVGETDRIVTDDIGLRVPLEAGAISDAILSLLADPGRARAMGAAGRARVLANHHVDSYVDYLRRVHDLATTGPVYDGLPLST